jgi:hypothetical protein
MVDLLLQHIIETNCVYSKDISYIIELLTFRMNIFTQR